MYIRQVYTNSGRHTKYVDSLHWRSPRAAFRSFTDLALRYNSPSMPLLSGTRVGPYEILALIGPGGLGEVCRARDPQLDRDGSLLLTRYVGTQEIYAFDITWP